MIRKSIAWFFAGALLLAAFCSCPFSQPGGDGDPTVSILAPFEGSSFDQSSEIGILADPYDSDGEIVRVSFYVDGDLLGSTTESPWRYGWTGGAVGSHALTATAVDDDGNTGTSTAVNISITSTTTPTTTTWARQTANAGFLPRNSHTSVVFNNRIYVIGGLTDEQPTLVRSDEVWSTANGTTWTCDTSAAAFGAIRGHSSAVFGGSMYVIGGSTNSGVSNDVYRSSNGSTWTVATADPGFSPRFYHASVVYNNILWVIGGNDGTNALNDIWYTYNGTTWYQETASAPFGTRWNFAAAADTIGIWVIAGLTGDSVPTYYDDVWFYNGESWSMISDGVLPDRACHAAIYFNGALWVTGGAWGSALSDTQRSTDVGATWTAQSGTTFSARYGHTMVAFNSQLWIIGGASDTDILLSDVWYKN